MPRNGRSGQLQPREGLWIR